MKKLFLISLMALCTCVMAWAADAHVSTIADLNAKLADASVETIYLDADLTYAGEKCINILRSVTIDGQGHTLNGEGIRVNSTKSSLAINQGAPGNNNWIDYVALKNLKINNPNQQPLNVRCNLTELVIENCSIIATGSSGYVQPITFGGNQSTPVDVTITNSIIEGKSYPIITFNPINLTMTDTKVKGWCSVYFKAPSSSAGSNGSTLVATNCVFDAQNYNSGSSDSFGAFVLEDDGINVTLDNCQVNSTAHYTPKQSVFCLSEWKSILSKNMHLDPCEFVIKGDNTEFVGGDLLSNKWDGTIAECPVTFTVYGGTFDEDLTGKFSVATGFHMNILPTVKDGEEITLYRVVKDAPTKEVDDPENPGSTIEVLYDLNDLVAGEGVAEGNNPVSSFDLSTGTPMTLNQETTTAGYVQVSDKDNGVDPATPTTVTVGTPSQDQTLVINNGLDVQGESQVIVQAGSTLQIGEGGLTTESPENIVITANENGAASLLLDPEVIVNNTPNLTVKMTAKQIGRDDRGDYYWHRFALPLAAGATWTKEGSLGDIDYPTYVYAWDYTANDWKNIAPTDMEPLQGYTLTLASEYIDGDAADGKLDELQDVVYTFTGNLIGNTNRALTFREEGFNFFGNSYTGYMDVKTMLNGLESGNIDGTVYMWCNDPDNEANQSYVGVSLYKLNSGRGLEKWMKEVAPMQTFILRLRGANSADESVNYAASIWGNPRYGHSTAAPAPRRAVAAISEDTYMEIAVKAANGKGDRVDFTEAANNSDAFESGYDVEKYMNERSINLYATIDGMNYSSVVTDDVEGKTLSLKTNDEIAYTISFKNVEGTEYALRDNVTGKVIAIEEGTTYDFAAQPNSTVEGRFEIVKAAKVTTAIENAEVKANVKGIYTITGQYLGENFDVLPAGVYVVDGVKIVK